MYNKKTLYWAFIGSTIFTLSILILFLLRTTELDFSLPIATNIFADYGTLVGGILAALFSLISIVLVIQSISQQAKQNELQNLEARFFELMKMHRDNVTQFQIDDKLGRDAVVVMYNEFNELFETIKRFYPANRIKNNTEWNIRCVEITYLILFFGLDDKTLNQLEERIIEVIGDKEFYEKEFYPYTIHPLVEVYKKEAKGNKNKPKVERTIEKYGGYQAMLGHYFRHLYQIVTYINGRPTSLITYKDKYLYIKSLRAQLSNHEQALFFYNSLTFLGKSWERGMEAENCKLITKYNFIKNIPKGFAGSIDPKLVYPDVFYEFDSKKTNRRIELEKLYS